MTSVPCRRNRALLIESVEALVNAIAQGTIKVELPERGAGLQKDNLRIAPSLLAICRKQETSELDKESLDNYINLNKSLAYNPLSIALFLHKVNKGGASEAVRAVIDALNSVS